MKVFSFFVALVLLVGCSSTSKLTLADQAYIKSLSEAEQAHIADGDPTVGDSVRGLMIAFGKPAFTKEVPEGIELTYYSVTSKRYPRTIEHFHYNLWDATTDLHILVCGKKIARIKATPHYEDRNSGPSRPIQRPTHIMILSINYEDEA